MASPDRSKQKTFKAKKTMPASCRKQVEILNKSMDMEALKTTAIKNDNQNLCTMVTIRECRHSENVDSPLESKKNSAFSQKSHTQKKRMFSENKENVKRMKTSEQINENVSVALEKQTTVMEQVKHLIREEICSRNYKPIDKKLEELNERIGKTQCKNKYEQIAEGLFAKIAKLQRRIQAVVLLQRNYLQEVSGATHQARPAGLPSLTGGGPFEGQVRPHCAQAPHSDSAHR
ncbi:activating transcription factor 7-interacting protein 2 [Ctenodactylus gundi]